MGGTASVPVVKVRISFNSQSISPAACTKNDHVNINLCTAKYNTETNTMKAQLFGPLWTSGFMNKDK